MSFRLLIKLIFFIFPYSNVDSYITWLSFSRCKKKVSDEMATNIIWNRGDDQKMMNSVCRGLNDLIFTCSHNILNKCFNLDTIHNITNGLLENMKPSLDKLKVC